MTDLLSRTAAGGQTANIDRGEAPSPEFYKAIDDWRASSLFTLRERLAIEYAERIAEAPMALPYDDDLWDRLHANFDEGEIVDLTYSIGCWIAMGRFVHVLGLDGTCPSGQIGLVEAA